MQDITVTHPDGTVTHDDYAPGYDWTQAFLESDPFQDAE